MKGTNVCQRPGSAPSSDNAHCRLPEHPKETRLFQGALDERHQLVVFVQVVCESVAVQVVYLQLCVLLCHRPRLCTKQHCCSLRMPAGGCPGGISPALRFPSPLHAPAHKKVCIRLRSCVKASRWLSRWYISTSFASSFATSAGLRARNGGTA